MAKTKRAPGDVQAILDGEDTPLQKARKIKKMFPHKKDQLDSHIRRWRDAQFEVDQTFLYHIGCEVEFE